MYWLIYRKKPENDIKLFIKSYKNIFLNTFTDTGLFYEDIIRNNYIENSEKFYNEIIDNIDICLQENKILWYSVLKNKNMQIIIIIWAFRLFVEYSEKLNKKTRYVENIEFHKK